jgi:glycosyltransferase involved in cell wall biosynthesis
VLAYFDGFIRALNNEENLGFVHGNNKGAALARGKYLVFLNNDTVVLPGWLDQMVQTAEDDPQVGVVGPMFIYPDWTLQEAGSIVWRNADAYHYGWGRSPDDRRYNFAREVDYITGASLLIRRNIWDELGGFDTRYAPIYYEDTDLCMGARALGFKVIYQPRSRILHFEGATSGTDTRTGLKRFQVINREKFHEKWREVLERDHYPYDPANDERAANRKRGPYVLIVDDRFPTPDRDAGSARMVAILKAMTEWCKPVFIPVSKHEWPEEEKRLWQMGVETARIVDYKRLIKQRKFYAAVVSRPHVAEAMIPAIQRADRRIKIVFDMVDAHFIRMEREHKVTGAFELARAAAAYRKVESRMARRSDLIWCNSSEDKKVMGSIAPGVPIAVVPTIHDLRGRGLPFEERAHLLFVGNFLHRPNVDGVVFFLQEIFPLVRASVPGVELHIVGDNTPPEISECESESVKVRGYVPDVGPLFHQHRVMIAPVRFGAGVKGKIGEALAHSLPVVTTTMGAEGMALQNGLDAMIADAPQEFADNVIKLYRDREFWQKLSDNSYQHAENNFTPKVVGRIINNSVRELADSPRELGQKLAPN